MSVTGLEGDKQRNVSMFQVSEKNKLRRNKQKHAGHNASSPANVTNEACFN